MQTNTPDPQPEKQPGVLQAIWDARKGPIIWLVVWNVVALLAIVIPLGTGAAYNAPMDIAKMRETFPAIGVAVKTKQWNDCLNDKKDKESFTTKEELKKTCRQDNLDKQKDDIAWISLGTFVDDDFSIYEDGKKADEQREVASVWHYYTTFREYAVKYTGYHRYEKGLCDDTCIKEKMLDVTVKNGTLEDHNKNYAGADRMDEIGIFLDTYKHKVFESDIYAFTNGMSAEHAAAKPFLYRAADGHYKVVKFDQVFYEFSVTSAAQNAVVTDTVDILVHDLLNSRTADGKTYLSQWEADVYNVVKNTDFVFVDKTGAKVKANFTTGSHKTIDPTCVTCPTYKNPSTPFMPVLFNGTLDKDASSYTLSPQTCKKAADDIRNTNAINTAWHVILLSFVLFGFMWKDTASREVKGLAKLLLILFFVNTAIINLTNIIAVWDCDYVKDFQFQHLVSSIVLLVWGFVIGCYEIGYKWWSKGEKEEPKQPGEGVRYMFVPHTRC